jgi:hypothetical protein
LIAMTDEPAVLAWRQALSPRPRHTTHGRHWWREWVTDNYRSARAAWEARRESGASAYAAAGAANSQAAVYQLTDAEYADLFPPPTFGGMLQALSLGADPFDLEASR